MSEFQFQPPPPSPWEDAIFPGGFRSLMIFFCGEWYGKVSRLRCRLKRLPAKLSGAGIFLIRPFFTTPPSLGSYRTRDISWMITLSGRSVLFDRSWQVTTPPPSRGWGMRLFWKEQKNILYAPVLKIAPPLFGMEVRPSARFF